MMTTTDLAGRFELSSTVPGNFALVAYCTDGALATHESIGDVVGDSHTLSPTYREDSCKNDR